MLFKLSQLAIFSVSFCRLGLVFTSDSGSNPPAAESGLVFEDTVFGSIRGRALINKYRLVPPSSMGDGRVSLAYHYKVGFHSDGTTISYDGMVTSNASPEEICTTTVNAWHDKETESTTGIKEACAAGIMMHGYGITSLGSLHTVTLEMRYNQEMLRMDRRRPEQESASAEPEPEGVSSESTMESEDTYSITN